MCFPDRTIVSFLLISMSEKGKPFAGLISADELQSLMNGVAPHAKTLFLEYNNEHEVSLEDDWKDAPSKECTGTSVLEYKDWCSGVRSRPIVLSQYNLLIRSMLSSIRSPSDLTPAAFLSLIASVYMKPSTAHKLLPSFERNTKK